LSTAGTCGWGLDAAAGVTVTAARRLWAWGVEEETETEVEVEAEAEEAEEPAHNCFYAEDAAVDPLRGGATGVGLTVSPHRMLRTLLKPCCI
jgi:hypothetical protein